MFPSLLHDGTGAGLDLGKSHVIDHRAKVGGRLKHPAPAGAGQR